MSKFNYDGPLLTREEFLKGDVGVHLVDGAPITGTKLVNCHYLWHQNAGWWSTEECKVDIAIPAGEYVVNYNDGPYTKNESRDSRASGMEISPLKSVYGVTSRYHRPYVYDTTRINRPVLCAPRHFFNLEKDAVCGMHFEYDKVSPRFM